MTPELLASIVSIALAVIFAYFPVVAEWFQSKEPDVKRLLMAGFLLLAALGSFGYVCGGLGEIGGVVCDKAGALALFKVFVAAVIANQASFALLPKVGHNASSSEEKREAKPRAAKR